MHSKIYKTLNPIFQDILDEPSLVIHKDLSANDVANWDSLNHITLIVEIEALTGITFSVDDLIDMANVGDFVAFLYDKGYRG